MGRIAAYDGFAGLPPLVRRAATAQVPDGDLVVDDCHHVVASTTTMSPSSRPAPTIESSLADRSDRRFVALLVVVLEHGGCAYVRFAEPASVQRDGVGVDAVVIGSRGDIEDV